MPGRLALLCALALGHSVAIAENIVTLLTPTGPQKYTFANIQQRSTNATLFDADGRPDKAAAAQPLAAPLVAHARVIVQADSTAALRGTLGPMADLAQPMADVPGHWTLEQNTVGEAVALINRLNLASSAGKLAAAAPLSSIAPAAGIRAELDFGGRLWPRMPTDPQFGQQWYLHDIAVPAVDLRVAPAWEAGYTGNGVTIGIVDLGFRIFHPDLALNYSAMGSQTTGMVAFEHGTRCAGVAAAIAFNGRGGAGTAYRARLTQQIYGTTAQTAAALAFRTDVNQVKSCSFGPADSGRIVTMSSSERTALLNAVTSGRGGRGTIFTWAAGNGGFTEDRMDYDPYASNRFVIPVGAITDQDEHAPYSEPGAALLGVTPSSGGARGIFTTNFDAIGGDTYTDTFGMTSACAPMAAGIVALMLEANPALGWRDVQHVLIHTARRCDAQHPDWVQNGAGRWVNHALGFGVLDAAAAVAQAASWRNVRPAQTASVLQPVGAAIPDADDAGLTQTITFADDLRTEAVELTLNVQTAFVGDLEVRVTSPAGTEALLTTARSDSTDNFANYVFTIRRFWDENSAGPWRVRIADRRAGNPAIWTDARITVYGVNRSADMNCDRRADLLDIDGFITALIGAGVYAQAYQACDYWLADLNGDDRVDFGDIDGFVAALID